MEVKVGGSRSKIRNVDTDILFGYVERSGVSMSYSTGSAGGIGSAERTLSSSKGKEWIDDDGCKIVDEGE